MKITVTPVYDLNVHDGNQVGTVMRIDQDVNDETHVYYGYQIGTKVSYDSTWDVAHAVQMMLTEATWVASIEEAVTHEEPVSDDTLAKAASMLGGHVHEIELTPDGKDWDLSGMDKRYQDE